MQSPQCLAERPEEPLAPLRTVASRIKEMGNLQLITPKISSCLFLGFGGGDGFFFL